MQTLQMRDVTLGNDFRLAQFIFIIGRKDFFFGRKRKHDTPRQTPFTIF